MTKYTSLSISVDAETKKKAEEICKGLGTTLSNAVNMFLASLGRCNGFPFALTMERPNDETVQAMEEARNIARDPSVKGYKDVSCLMRDLLD